MFTLSELKELLDSTTYNTLLEKQDRDNDASGTKYDIIKPIAVQRVTAETGYTETNITASIKQEIKPEFAWLCEYLICNQLDFPEQKLNLIKSNFVTAIEMLRNISLTPNATQGDSFVDCIIGAARW